MEMINGDGFLHGTYHWSNKNVSCDDQQNGGMKLMPSGWGQNFHEFAVEYNMNSIKFALDGTVYHTIDKSSLSSSLQHSKFFNVPYYVILNTAVGQPWAKPASQCTQFPTKFFIDYVWIAKSN